MKDAIIILGGGINQNGTLSKISRRKVEEGVMLFNQAVSIRIIMSGAYSLLQDLKEEIPIKSEAEAMREYAIELGVPGHLIFIETNSEDTIGNAYFTKINFLENNNWKRIIVVTSDYHIRRTKLIFNLVMGHDYQIDYLGADTHLVGFKKIKINLVERLIIKIQRHYLKNIKLGDSESVGEIIRGLYPGYTRSLRPIFIFLKKCVL